MSLTLATGHSTGTAVTAVPLPIMVVPEASPPSNNPNLPTVPIPSALAIPLSLCLLGDLLSDKLCADLQALVVVHRSRQGSIGCHKFPRAP